MPTDVMTAIHERRATRAYTDEMVDRSLVEQLIEAAIQAPSAMNRQPWAFVIVEGAPRLTAFSDEVKKEVLRGEGGHLSPDVRAMLGDASFDVFYGAPVLVVICATSTEAQAAEDCSLAAQNLMLAAHAAGLATCPIGFARQWLNRAETKRRLEMPEDLVPIFPLVLGHPSEKPQPHARRAPRVLWL
ncbi:MAG TPA: nitroreductase [Candidatus Dormibacteraeota bacterium]|nr:nitroreductase [Candidatus Dormibacteraeota bacterium]